VLHPTLDLQLQVGRASLVSPEAELECMLQMFQPEMGGTPWVASIEERAMADPF
jgi:hypothetical protein